MKTAVERYAEEAMRLEIKKAKGNISVYQMLNELSNLLNQAKEMEREQIVKAYTDTLEFTPENISKGEQYYNENYNL
jgi:predicted nuclease with TOPRIM domain